MNQFYSVGKECVSDICPFVSLLASWTIFSNMSNPPKSTTYGVLLLGGFVAMVLSGIVTVQGYVYFRLYSSDLRRIKYTVALIWVLDTFHSYLVCAAIWHYLISNFGDSSAITYVPWTVAFSIASTATVTFLVQSFFVHRIFKFSKRNWFLTAPITFLVFLRPCIAFVTTTEMLHLKTFTKFKEQFRWAFTLGLSLSSGVDVIMTGTLCYFLWINRSGSPRSNHIIDLLLLYTSETGALTSAATLASMICWLTMPQNLVFMGIHFVIGKLYANSLLLTLNTRKQLRKGWVKGFGGEQLQPTTFFSGLQDDPQRKEQEDPSSSSVPIPNPKKTVECDTGDAGRWDDAELASPSDDGK